MLCWGGGCQDVECESRRLPHCVRVAKGFSTCYVQLLLVSVGEELSIAEVHTPRFFLKVTPLAYFGFVASPLPEG